MTSSRARSRGERPGPHTLRLQLFTPSGHLYQVLAIPFAAAGGPARRRSPGGLPRARRPVVSATLPVAGTAIMANALYGSWTLTAHLDGNAEPCGRAQTFVIRQ